MIMVFAVFGLVADENAVTETGKKVLLKDDGTWEYLPKEEVLDNNKWGVSEKINPVDDSKTILFILKADEGEGIYGNPVYLILRYKSGETVAYINWNSYLGSEVFVLTRLGNKDATKNQWYSSNDSKASFYPWNNIIFIQALMSVDRLVAQVTPYHSIIFVWIRNNET